MIYVLIEGVGYSSEPLGYFLDPGPAHECLEWMRECDPENSYSIIEIKPYLLADSFIRDYSDEVHEVLSGMAL